MYFYRVAINTWKQKLKTIPFIISQKMKYIGIKILKHVQYLYTENYKTLIKGNNNLSK